MGPTVSGGAPLAGMGSADEKPDGTPGTMVCDGQRSCVRGAFVRVADEFLGWDVFRRFRSKVGVLTHRHFSGMWYADFPGEDEYGFLCGPLLFQLQYSSDKEARECALALEQLQRQQASKNAAEAEKSKKLAQALEKRTQELSATTMKLFEQMAIIREEMHKTEMDLGKMELAFTDLTAHANTLDADLSVARTELITAQSANVELQSQLADARAMIERLEQRITGLSSETDKMRAEMEAAKLAKEQMAKELLTTSEHEQHLERENSELNSQNAKLVAELDECRSQLSEKEESFLGAAAEAREFRDKWALAAAELKELKERPTGAMTDEERERLMDRMHQIERDLMEMTRFRDELRKKCDDAEKRYKDVMRKLDAKKGPDITQEEYDALCARADAGDKALNDMDAMRKKFDEMEALAKEGKKVLMLQKDIEQRDRKIASLNDMVERYKADAAKLNEEVRKQHQQVQLMEQERDDLLQKLKDMTDTKNQLAEEGQEKQRRIEDLDHRVVDLTQEVAIQRARADDRQAYVDALIAERTDMLNTLSARNESISELNLHNENLQTDVVRLTGENTELAKQLEILVDQVKNSQERERQIQEEMEAASRTAEERICDLQEELSNLRPQYNELQDKYTADTERLTYNLELLRDKNEKVSLELNVVQREQQAERKLVRLYFHKIEHRISVAPRRVLFKLWHLTAVAIKYWTAADTKKAQEAEVRKAKAEAKSLRNRLGAAHRLVEEMERRDKSIASAQCLLAPPTSAPEESEHASPMVGTNNRTLGNVPHQDSTAKQLAAGTASKLSAGGGLLAARALAGDVNCQTIQKGALKDEVVAEEGETASGTNAETPLEQCKTCLVHASHLEGLNQRCTRLERDAKNSVERAKLLGEQKQDLSTQLVELKKQMSVLGCLRLANKQFTTIKDRKTALEARTICQSMTVALLDKERSLQSQEAQKADQNQTGTSAIVTRKAELEAEALSRGSTLQDDMRVRQSSKYKDFMDLAAQADEIAPSIFDQLDVLTGQVSDLVMRHEGHRMRRARRDVELIQNATARLEPVIGAKKQPSSQILDRFPAANNTWLPPRPQTSVS